ncbi:MAG: response regulator [Desulfobacteraceae bacterium]|nr:response regulator [Desulfobacteraceae bacterium]
MRQFFENIPVAAYRNTGGPTGKFLLGNPAMVKLFKHETIEGFKKSPVSEAYQNPEEREQVVSELQEKGFVLRKKLQLKKADGTPFWGAITTKARYDEKGNFKWFDGIIEDVTLEKEYEELLISEKERAQAAAKAKSEFLANMSHEIRTPMNGVVGMLEILLETKLTSEQKEFLLSARYSADSLLILINDILDFSKIEAGQLSLEAIDFKLSTTMDVLGDVVGFKAFEKGLEFVIIIHEDVPLNLIGDPGRLSQVLINLTGNAIKFTEKGEIYIRVSVKEDRADDVMLLFEVVDTGVGLPEDRKVILFDAFTQADASTTRKYGGTGLGLAISKQLAEIMGGEIGFSSELGKGSNFWFTCVLKKQTSVQEQIVLSQNIVNTRILIVDHAPINHEVMREYLKSWKCRCTSSYNAQSALQALKDAVKEKDPFDLALVDIEIPNMSGDQLGEAIKQDTKISDTILVMLSASTERGDTDKMKSLGFSAFLTKPIKRSMLFDCLRTVIGISDKGLSKTLITQNRVEKIRENMPVEIPPMNILLVEDNRVNQKVAQTILKKMGHSITIAFNGKESLDILEKQRFDIVLMDIQMPVMGGEEATIKIREKEKNTPRHIPVIALTANAMKGDRERFIKAGMDDYIAKPFKKKDLVNVLLKFPPES